MVAEHGGDDPVQGGPGATTGGMDIPVEAAALPPTPGEVPQAQLPVEPGETTAGPAAAASAPDTLGQQSLGSQAAFTQFNIVVVLPRRVRRKPPRSS